MVKRFGFTWSFLSLTLNAKDLNNDPVAPTESWLPFKCDAQLQTGRFIAGSTGDQISVTYSAFVAPNSGMNFSIGGMIKDHNGIERKILGFEFNYLLV